MHLRVLGILLVGCAALAGPQSASAQDYFDDFDRADAADLNDGWIEKAPGAFSISGNAAAKNAVGTAYRDNIVYRPASEDLTDVEASVEMDILDNAVGYPQIFVRVQSDTVANGNRLDGYILYVNNSQTQAILGRQTGSQFVTTLATLNLTTALNTTDRFRLRLRAVGIDPVALDAWVERDNAGQWETIGQASVLDTAAQRITSPGAVGFGGFIEASYRYDNFNRLDLEGDASNPLPVTSGLTPSSATEGSPGFDLVVQGSDFVAGSTVRWNGADRNTTFISSTELRAAISATDIELAGTSTVTVFSPEPGGGLSNAQTFTVDELAANPVPAITQLTPDTVTSGGQGFNLDVAGSGFVAGSVVRVNGADRQTTFVSSTALQAIVEAADIQNAGTLDISVSSPTPGGGISNVLALTVEDPAANPVPVISGMNPDGVVEGSGAFALTVLGQDFNIDSTVQWNGAERPTTFVSATELTADISAADVAASGSADVTVTTPAPGGGTSNTLVFAIEAAGGSSGLTQTLDGISPISAPSGGSAFTMTLEGTGFTQNSEVRVGGIPVPTTFVSASELQAAIDSGLLATGLRSAITVFTPEADNVVSAPQTLFILEDGEQLYFDNFNRPDSNDIGNGWTEKAPDIFSLANGEVSGNASPTRGFNDAIVYRPIAEDGQNVEVGMEFVRPPGSASRYPQVHARVQRSTVDLPGELNSYTFFFDAYQPGQVHITPVDGFGECYIATFPLTQPFVDGDRYRLRFRVTDTNPVEMVGYLDHLNVDFWEVVAAGTVLHDENTEQVEGGYCNTSQMIPAITGSGSTGFAKWRDATDQYDNYYVIVLGESQNPLPATGGLTPASAVAGGAGFSLTVVGSGFVPGSTVRWDGEDRPTTYISPNEIRAAISSADIAVAGTASVAVFNPMPGGGLSNAQTFTIEEQLGNPLPVVQAVTPDIVVVDSAGFTLTVDGSGFIAGSTVRWNGADRPTTFVSPTELQAAIPATDIETSGTATITVFNGAPGGGESSSVTVTVLDPGTDYFDDFSRPDSDELGGGWIEKQPGAFSVVDGEARKNPVSTGYRDNIVYRPASEDLLDVEASIEFRMTNPAIGYPQLWVRAQSDTVATPDVVDGYLLYFNNSTSQVVLGRQTGNAFVETLATLFLTSAVNETDQYRMRMRATGTDPVTVTAYVERLTASGWEVIGQASVDDTAPNRIDTAGSVGFGGFIEESYVFDNFTRLFLAP